jgi:hypothetical protein
LPFFAAYCRFLPLIAAYCRFLPLFAAYCRLLPLFAAYCRFCLFFLISDAAECIFFFRYINYFLLFYFFELSELKFKNIS